MTRLLLIVVLFQFSLFSPTQTAAQTSATTTISSGWAGTATLGASSSSGNTSTSSTSADIRLGKTIGRWEHLIFGTVFKGNSSIIVEERDEETGAVLLDDSGRPIRRIIKGSSSDRRAVGYQPKFFWRPKTFVFAIVDWESDEPANIDWASRQVIGLGYKFYDIKQGFLSGEAGVGNKHLEQVFGEDIKGSIGYLGVNLLHAFTETIKLNADLRSDFGSDNTFVELGLGLTFAVSGRVAIKLNHYTRYNSDIEDTSNPLSSKSDSVTSLNLVFSI